MRKRRQLVVNLVKTKQGEEPEIEVCDIDLKGKLTIFSTAFQKIATTIGTGVIIYVVADTARQVIVARNTPKP